MTAQQQDNVKQMRESLQAAAAVVVIVAFAGGVVIWAIGGFAPQTQVQVQQLTASIAGLQRTVEALGGKVDAMPRAVDYTALDAHLSRIDVQVATIIDRLTRDEIESAQTRQEIRQLRIGTDTPVRQPR